LNSPRSLQAFVAKARKRAFTFGLLRVVCVAAACLGLAPLLSTAAIWFVPEHAAVIIAAVFAGLGATGAGVAGFFEWRSARPLISMRKVVELLTVGKEAVRDLIVTGVDLAAWGEEGSAERGVSAELTRAQVYKALTAAEGLDVRAVAPLGPLALRAACAVLVLFMIAVWNYADPGGAATAWGVALRGGKPDPVSVGNLAASYAPPAYMGLPEKRLEGIDGSIEAYRGTYVVLEGELSRAISGGQWEGPDSLIVPLKMDGEKFSVSWILDKAGSYSIVFFDDGQEVASDFTQKPVMALDDERPVVEMPIPEEDLEVTTSEEIKVEFKATDDFGVDKVELVLDGDEEVRIPVNISPSGSVTGSATFIPAVYPELGAGAHLRVEAWDGDTVSGAKVGVGRSVYVSFLDARRLMDEIENLEDRLLDALLFHLADHLELTSQEPGALSGLRDKAQDLMKLFEQLVERVQLGAEEGALGALAVVNMEKGLRSVIEPFLEGDGDRGPIVRELEKDILFIDKLLKSLRMEEALNMGDELTALQRDLFDALDAGATPEDLMNRLEQIDSLMKEMMERLMKNSGEMPDAFANSDAVKDMPASEFQKLLSEIREALQQGDMEKATELAQELMESLSRWMAQMEEAAQGASSGEMDPILKELAEAEREVDDISLNQEELLQKTQKLSQDAAAEAAEALKDEIETFAQKQEQRLQEILRQTSRMESAFPRSSSHWMNRRMPGSQFSSDSESQDSIGESGASKALKVMDAARRTRDNVRETRRTLRQEFGRARAQVESLLESIDDLREEAMSGAEDGDPRKASAEQAGKVASQQGRAILDDLDALAKKAGEKMSEETKKTLESLAQKQQELAERTGQAAEKLQQLGGKMPMLGPGPAQKTGGAKKSMQGAGSKLGGRNPGGSIPGQTQALEKLAEVSQELRDAQQKMQEGSGSGGMSQMGQPRRQRNGGKGGRDIDRGPVEIPKETEARELRAFRDEVLKAMQEGEYPTEYEDEVKRYYERLIR